MPGPKPNVIVSRAGGEPVASPVSAGALPLSLCRRTGRPGVIVSRRWVQVRISSRTSAGRSARPTIERGEHEAGRTGVAMPAWCAPWNGTVPARLVSPKLVAAYPGTLTPANPAAPPPVIASSRLRVSPITV